MPIPDFVRELRVLVGTHELWLSGVSAVVLREVDGHHEVLLVRRADNGAWSPVAGIVDPGEEPHDAAVRECLEETGVRVEVERLVWVRAGERIVYANGDRARNLSLTFRCRWVSGQPYAADDENLEAAWWPAHSLPPMPGRFADRVAVALADEPECRLGPLPAPGRPGS